MGEQTMRCPYCGRNSEQGTYCSYCGRDLRIPPQQQPVAGQQPLHQQPQQGYPTSAPRQQPPYQQPRQGTQATGYPPPPQARRTRQPEAPPPPHAPAPEPPPPDAPAPFPPHTVEHLHALEPGALA